MSEHCITNVLFIFCIAEGYPWYGRNYNLAIEAWSGLPGNLTKAIENGSGIKINPGQEISTRIKAFSFEMNK